MPLLLKFLLPATQKDSCFTYHWQTAFKFAYGWYITTSLVFAISNGTEDCCLYLLFANLKKICFDDGVFLKTLNQHILFIFKINANTFCKRKTGIP